ncbi:hypothetical protein AHF37_09178 [Paragonimus kellicotti]|nr:hypothetical protein AHF37_09178 [Paragonimus kellicotti]
MEIKNGVRIRRGTAGRGLSNADFLLIVDADVDDQCKDGFLGFATVCQVDDSLNRKVSLLRTVNETFKCSMRTTCHLVLTDG